MRCLPSFTYKLIRHREQSAACPRSAANGAIRLLSVILNAVKNHALGRLRSFVPQDGKTSYRPCGDQDLLLRAKQSAFTPSSEGGRGVRCLPSFTYLLIRHRERSAACPRSAANGAIRLLSVILNAVKNLSLGRLRSFVPQDDKTLTFYTEWAEGEIRIPVSHLSQERSEWDQSTRLYELSAACPRSPANGAIRL